MTTTHLLLDIEGTTCPISFVARVLFPYAESALPQYLKQHQADQEIQVLICEAWKEWRSDPDPKSQQLLNSACNDLNAIQGYFQHLIKVDRKSTALKDLQGRIWKQGYTSGEITSELFPETISALQALKQTGLMLGVYSSGSINAQKLLYQYTNAGDQRNLFSFWFDTRTGPKKEPQSYRSIADQLNTPIQKITFVSDSQGECNAAKQAGMRTLFSLRADNPDQDPGEHTVIKSLDQIMAAISV